MQKMSPLTETPSQQLLSSRPRILHSGALTAANTRALYETAMPQEGQEGDLRGQRLRRLRLQLNHDAVSLASQACISLRQLYQLESGETSLFYNTGLRDQAGRRVAKLLGADWETLHLAPEPEPVPEPVVADKPLKLVSAPAASLPSAAAHPASAPNAEPLQDTAATQATPPGAVTMGLQRPASETLAVPAPHTAQIRPVQTPVSAPRARRARWPRWLLVWTLCALGGLAIGWAIGVYTPLSLPLLEAFIA